MSRTIIFDLTKTQPLSGAKFHGGGKYGEAVFFALIEKTRNVVGWYDSKRYINPKIIGHCKELGIVVEDANEVSIVNLCKRLDGIVYLPVLDENTIKNLPQNLCIITIHGERVLELPTDDYEYKYSDNLQKIFKNKYFKKIMALKRKRESLEKVRRIVKRSNVRFVVVSEHTKASLLSFVPGLKFEDVRVLYSPLAINSNIQGVSLVEGKYYLLVSADRWVKNAYRAISAFEQLFEERPELEGKVVITGLNLENPIMRGIKHKDRFLCMGYVDDCDLEVLYRDAYLFVYPSLNEGFGYPPLEAMARNTPVIASAIASIPEICGDAAMYFNPYSVDEIKMRILQMEDETVRRDYIERGNNRYQYISSKQKRDLDLMADMIVEYSLCECPVTNVNSYENNGRIELPAKWGGRKSSNPMVWVFCGIGA